MKLEQVQFMDLKEDELFVCPSDVRQHIKSKIGSKHFSIGRGSTNFSTMNVGTTVFRVTEEAKETS